MAIPFSRTINGVEVPYEASMKELEAYLKGEMKYYPPAARALAWRNTKESFYLLKRELYNADGYRRRVALENIEYHTLWKENYFLVKNMLWDNNSYVIRLALRNVTLRNMEGVVNEVLFVMEQFEQDKEILLEISLQGCGYACLIATVFQYYAKQQEEFQKIFGVSFANEEGKTCFNEMLIRFYCMTRTGVEEILKSMQSVQKGMEDLAAILNEQ